MRPEAYAVVTLEAGGDIPATPTSAFGFIVNFGGEAYSAAVIPHGSSTLVQGVPTRVQLQFFVDEAKTLLRTGASFKFFEQGRIGRGEIQ